MLLHLHLWRVVPTTIASIFGMVNLLQLSILGVDHMSPQQKYQVYTCVWCPFSTYTSVEGSRHYKGYKFGHG